MSDTVINLPAAPPKREIQNVVDAVPILDTARFEHMQRIAAVLARSTMIPETLRCFGPKEKRQDLPFEQVLSNCFLVVNQAARWGMDPFSVISCCAVVHGRLAYEGKLVSAVLAAKLGISLNHYFTGDSSSDGYRIYLCDRPFNDELIAQLKPGAKIPGLRLWDGSVGEWKTSGAGTPWTPKNYPRMLIYRGTRDWTRIYEPAILLGVYTEDELADLTEDARARRATPVSSVSLVDRLAAAKAPTASTEGFSYEHITRETEAQREAGHNPSPPASTADEALASAEEPVSTDFGEVQNRSESTSPTNSDSLQLSVSPAGAAAKPVADDAPIPNATGTNSESSVASPADDTAQAGNVVSTGLPQGWEKAYATILRAVPEKKGLTPVARRFWAKYGSWSDHKDTPDGASATAIFDAIFLHFGNADRIDEALRELI